MWSPDFGLYYGEENGRKCGRQAFKIQLSVGASGKIEKSSLLSYEGLWYYVGVFFLSGPIFGPYVFAIDSKMYEYTNIPSFIYRICDPLQTSSHGFSANTLRSRNSYYKVTFKFIHFRELMPFVGIESKGFLI